MTENIQLGIALLFCIFFFGVLPFIPAYKEHREKQKEERSKAVIRVTVNPEPLFTVETPEQQLAFNHLLEVFGGDGFYAKAAWKIYAEGGGWNDAIQRTVMNRRMYLVNR